MEKGNILVIGSSGVGKSTLINAVLGTEFAKTGWGYSGTTKEISVYDTPEAPFRLIDTMGFEPSLLKEWKAVNAVRKWSREGAKAGDEHKIDAIWFCISGTSSKLFPSAIKELCRATQMWKNVPVVAVITKSYSVPERENNVFMVKRAFEAQKYFRRNLCGIVPVVAATYRLNDEAMAPPEGITELIDLTNNVLPEGMRASSEALSKYRLNRKRILSQGLIASATAVAVTVGAVPIPFSDAALLIPTETAEVNGLAKIYGISKDDKSRQFFSAIIEVGTVSIAAKAAISALKAVPGINVAASVINAVIAGSFAAAIGEATAYIFEKVSLGEKSIDDIEWARKIVESRLGTLFVDIAPIIEGLSGMSGEKSIVKSILETVFKKKKNDDGIGK